MFGRRKLMDIAGFSTVKAVQDVKFSVSAALTKNVMDIAKQEGAQLNEMIEKSAVQATGRGQNVDIKL